jgi:C-terminal processing protease CtpA/Prc
VLRSFAISLLLAGCCFGQFPGETDRLMATAKLWVTVEYFHPYLAYRDIDWDQALVKAIPKIRAAKSTDEYRAAVSGMLEELGDPETFLIPLGENVEVVSGPTLEAGLAITKPVQAAPQITWVHTAGGSYFVTKPGLNYPIGTIADKSVELNEYQMLPGVTAALASEGEAAIRSTAHHYQIETTEKIVMDFPGMSAVVRLSEPIKPTPIINAAASKTVEFPIPPAPIIRPPYTRYTDAYPSTEARLLAAIKTWGAVHYFFAYKDLMDEDWDDTFSASLPKFIEAKDAVDYNLTLADLLTHLTDSNVIVHSKTMDTYFGEAPVGLRIRLLDRYPIVTDVLDPAAKAAGVQPGDVVKRIAGISTTDIFRRFVQYIPASTPQRSGYDTIQKVTNGPAGSDVELTIENAQGEAHIVKLTRAEQPASQRSGEAVRILAGNIGYLDLDRLSVEGVDKALEQLQDSKAIILDLRGKAPAAAAIARHLTSQSNVADALVTTPLALHPDTPTDGIATQTASTFVVQTLPAPQAPFYKGKTVALIDERTIGESEQAALLFEAANKTEFVGSPTAGADSSVAELPLPGGITITYSTEDIRHANGGKLQRLGIQPSINAPTTAKGLRAGKDEALEAALAHLTTGR